MTKKRSFSIGPGVDCDIERLVNSRLLLQAASGAGKSWALRRLLEQTFGSVQQLVIDPEGEFASLRERFDYVLAARQGGDTLADPRTAKLLAERLLELGASAILDISELKAHERIAFVKLFVDAITEAPKALWHPCLVVLDEAQMFAPENGEAESADAVSSIATRGRKRGFCLVAATQRLSSLSKNVAAQLSNKLIGRTSLDVDVKRAAYELGFSTQEERRALRDLEDGEFFAFGPALTKTVAKVKVGTVQTQHPKAGSALAARVPPPTDRVKALLPKLSDLPAEAEAREKTVADLKRELSTTRRELTEARKAQPPAPATKEKRVEVLTDSDRALLVNLGTVLAEVRQAIDGQGKERINRVATKAREEIELAVASSQGQMTAHADAVAIRLERPGFQRILDKLSALSPQPPAQDSRRPAVSRAVPPTGRSSAATRPNETRAPRGTDGSGAAGNVSPARQKILNGLAFLAGIGVPSADKTQLALIVGVSPTSGGYFNNLGALRSSGLIEYPTGGTVALTDVGASMASTDGVPSTTRELHDAIRAKLPPAKWKILEALIKVYPAPLLKDDLAAAIEVSPTSGGYFNNLGSLRSLGLISYPRPSEVAAQPVLFLEER